MLEVPLHNRYIDNPTGAQAMTRKQTTFASTLSTHLEDGAIFTIGDCCVCLRLSERETYSNLKEFADDGTLVPQFTDMLDAALTFAKASKPAAAFNPTLVAHAFLCQLRDDIGEADFREVVRKEKEVPVSGVCYSHDYCDANMTMDVAMASVGIVALPDDEDGMPDSVVALWNAAWDHAKRRMAAMPI